MPSGGRLQLACGQENGRVCIRVEDTGCGIPLRDQERLFEPFFSTKSSSHHGLGLYVCYTLLKSVGGEIAVESRAGEGTAFTVRIPKAVD
jgi:signal transduction histidine kinase